MSGQVEVLPMIADRDEVLATLDIVRDPLREVAANEQFVTLIEDKSTAAMPIHEIAYTLSGQMAPMRKAVLALMPYVEDRRDGDGLMSHWREAS